MPFFGATFITYTLEQLAPKRNHIHECAMQVCNLEPDAMQPAIMEYIIANEDCPPFLLDRVPYYVAGYMQREKELCNDG